jgi:HAD superfamily hydrolase (TIGR01509 family)
MPEAWLMTEPAFRTPVSLGSFAGTELPATALVSEAIMPPSEYKRKLHRSLEIPNRRAATLAPKFASERLAGREVSVNRFRAILFDVDGTMAETEEFHRRAFNEAFRQFDLPWVWDVATYGSLLRIAGGRERIRHFLSSLPEPRLKLSDRDIDELHRFKTHRYAELVRSGACELRPGIADLIVRSRERDLRLAIVTTTSRNNIGALLRINLGPDWDGMFEVIISGDDVPKKKPQPDAYLAALAVLGLPAAACLAIEDSRNGLMAAAGAGVPVLITRSLYFHDDDFAGAARVVDHLVELQDEFWSAQNC